MADEDQHVGQIATALGDGALLLEGFTASQRFSTPFAISCDVVSLDEVDFGPQLGTGVSLTVAGDALTGQAFHGLLAEASRIGEEGDAIRYRLVLRPWLWFLSLGRNSRIFQSMTAPAIIAKVFSDAGISNQAFSNQLTQTNSVTREYCVQYDESDFAFVSRLMEEEGISYYFQQSADQHVLVMCDGKNSHEDFAGGALPLNRQEETARSDTRLWAWDRHVQPVATSVTVRDFHLKRYGETLQAATSASAASSVTAELYHYPGGYSHLTDDGQTAGTGFAGLRLQAAQAEQVRYTGEGDVFAVPVGVIASVGPAVGDDGGEADSVLVIGAVHVFSGQRYAGRDEVEQVVLRVTLEAIPADTTWRPPLATPRPVARGPQTAVVTGPSGEVIYVDAVGRVRIQFPWDRLGASDETSTCWVRVSQGWADGAFGQIHIPRIGEEVIVDFFDGDMDRPVITGRVYNATKTVPYTLPDDKTKSTWKSQTVGDSGDYPDTVDPPQASTKGFNELRFEDKGGSEEIFIHAQRLFTGWYRFDETRTTGHNTTITVGYNRDITIKNNETKTVQEGDESHTISQGSLTTTISQGDETRSVSTGKRTTTIQSDESLTVSQGNMSTTVSQGNQSTTVSQGNHSTDVSLGNISVKADAGSITLEAMQQIQLKVGGNSVTIDQTGVTVKGIKISIEADAMLEEKAPMTQLEGSAMTTIKAAIVMIN